MGDLKQILRMVSPEECQALQDICEYNDITEEQLVSAPESIQGIEMFMHNLPRICCMSFFPNIVLLSLVQQNLGSIHGLHNCPFLEVLRLNENHIQRIEGLDACCRLKELYLHSNQIYQIRNLSHLSSLEILWLANNQIRKVEGLDNLGRLKELNLACNSINQLGEVVNLKMLEHLNVSATGIGSFKEIGNLTRLKNLKDLRFSDPNWGSSPIALLHNYQTYMLFRLQHLRVFDSQDLTEEAKQSAKATYTRKRVYYNMCIKSLQHNRENIASLSVKSESRRARSLQKTLGKLSKTQKELRQQMKQAREYEDCIKHSKLPSSLALEHTKRHDWWLRTKAMVTTLENQISHVMARLDTLREDMHVIKAKEKAAVDRKIHWLKVELDTGGNIRMEIGNPKDVWFKNCDNLITSRFSPLDYAPFGITGVRVLKVIRVHNRFLQDRWEKSFEGRAKLVKSRKKHVEYLLYGETLQSSDEFQCVVEEGFPYLPGQSNHGCHGPVLLSNSIGLADVRRLQVIAEQMQTANSWSLKAPGWLLVVKAYLGCSVQDLTVNLASPAAKKSTYPGADSVYRLHPSDPVQRSWFMFDSTLVVPEYLVEFQYTYKNEYGGGELSQRVAEKQKRMCFPQDVENCEQWKCVPFVDPVQGPNKTTTVVSPLSPCNTRSSRRCSKTAEKVAVLCNELILRNNTITDFSNVVRLNIHSCNISEIDNLRSLVNLKILELSFNKITRIKGLEGLVSLEKLDLSYNLIKRIEGLTGLTELVYLDLSGNEIWCSNDLRLLHLQVPGLLLLNLRNNPIEEEFGYQHMVIRSLPCISELDHMPVTSEKRMEASDSFTSNAVYVLPKSFSEWKFAMPSVFAADALDDFMFDNCPEVTKEDEIIRVSGRNLQMLKKARGHLVEGSQKDDSWYDEMEELHLEDQKIKSMDCFGKLMNLRRLFLSSNEISAIEGLDNCTLLEELILDNNHIEQVQALPQLQALWKLDLSRNYLTTCAHLNEFSALTQLSVEKNYIQSLKGLGELTCLMELYAANNQISDLRELVHIRELPKLMVVDLSGNCLCQFPDYRTYSIFSMKKLKVLDGRIVTSTEVAEARDKHVGRLTRESLEERVGRTCFNGIEVLDLSSRSLRHCGDVFQSKDLQNLVELNLNNNFLSTIHGLRYLKNLVVLRAENNNIENGSIIEGALPELKPQFSSSACAGDEQITATCAAQENLESFGAYNGLDSLEYLQLGRNAISSISSLNLQQTFFNIKILYLQDNRISKLDGLENLSHLEKLYLDHNSIKEIDAFSFAGLNKLKLLHMSDNVLRCLTNLEHLSALETLDLASNYLTSNRFGGLSSIDCLLHLHNLTNLSLANNPMSRQSFYRVAVINKLRQLHCLDGREIIEDEREEAEIYSGTTKDVASSVTSIDTSVMLENIPTMQGKVPLKVTSMNFETMCGPPSPKHTNTCSISNNNSNSNNYSHGNSNSNSNSNLIINSSINSIASLNSNIGKFMPIVSSNSKMWESMESKHEHIPVKNKNRIDTSKVIVVPLLLMKNFRNIKEKSLFDSTRL